MSSYTKESGVGLIEVMVSLLVLAIGLLGVAGLQTKSLSYTQNAYYRTQATNLAYDVIDRMRANKVSAKNSGYASNYNQTHSSAGDCSSSTCSSSQIASYDLKQWKQALQDTLPSGQGEIAVSGDVAIREISVSIKFDDSRGLNATLDPVVIEAAL